MHHEKVKIYPFRYRTSTGGALPSPSSLRLHNSPYLYKPRRVQTQPLCSKSQWRTKTKTICVTIHCPLSLPLFPVMTSTTQAGISNAVFFLFYDTINAFGAVTLLSTAAASDQAQGGGGGVFTAALFHLVASSVATVPCNLVRTPAEVVKQRLQVRGHELHFRGMSSVVVCWYRMYLSYCTRPRNPA